MAPSRQSLLRVDAFRVALAVGLAFTLLHLLDGVFAGRGLELPGVGRLERAAQDWALTRLRGARPPSGRVVIVAIDERSVEAEGRWPWSRAKLARLVDALAAGGVSAVGLDVSFSEEDEVGRRLARVAALVRAAREDAAGAKAAGRLDEAWAAARGPEPEAAAAVDPTELLADAIERAGNVTVGFTFLSGADAAGVDVAPRVARLRFFRTGPVQVAGAAGLEPAGDGVPLPVRFAGVVPPVPAVLAAADSGGFLTALPDPDGVLRRYPTVASAGGVPFPSLGVALLARLHARAGVPATVVPVGARGAPEALLEVRVGAEAIATDDAGRVPLAYTGRARDFPTWAATDVLHGRIPAADMRGRVAVVGTTAAGTWDQRVTPFDEAAPGVVTHATFVENVLERELLVRTPAVLAAELALLLAASLGLALLFSRVPPRAALPVALAAAAAWLGVAALALRRFDVVLAVGAPLAQLSAMYVAATSWRFFAEERDKRRARETFGRFLAPAVVDALLAEGGGIAPGGEKRVLTVLFSDLRGFTGISEALDPPALLALLNGYLEPMTEIVVAGHGGTLDKYVGDAIMAFWGAPLPQADHAARACRAALAMTEALERLRPAWRARGLPELDVRIGVNTGPMSVGFVGSPDRLYDYTVLGDAVNLASRLVGTNGAYGTRVLVGPETRAQAGDAIVTRELDRVRVKGRREPVAVHELLAAGPPTPALRDLVLRFEGALAAFRARRWDEAAAGFREVDRLRGGDPPSRVQLARCEALRRAPPGPEWDGVFELPGK